MKAAIIQYTPVQINPRDNFSTLISLCEEAASLGAKLIHLPEMCLTHYLWNSKAEIMPFAEEKTGPIFQDFAEFAQEYQVFLAYGYPEKTEGGLYNSQNLLNPQGKLIGHYRKRHLYDSDKTWANSGDLDFQLIETEIGKIGLGICMDLNYNDFINFHIINQTEILLLAVNWLEEGSDVTTYWSMRLWPFAGHCLIANRFGPEKTISFAGLSAFFSKTQLVSQAKIPKNQVLMADFSQA